MTGLNAGHVGIAGEVRCIVKREDGSTKEDTGFQKNLILNQGLDFFGGGKGVDIFASCAIGSGNAVPAHTQTQLSSFLAITTGTQSSIKYDYVPDASNLYKTNKVYKYIFTGLNNANVSEVGLVSQGTTSTNYYLCTRALLKDATGTPTTITVLLGETLEVYYKLWKIVSVLDASYTVNMLDGKGGITPYNCIIRPYNVGSSSNEIGNNATDISFNQTWFSSLDLSPITSGLPKQDDANSTVAITPYVAGTYKLQVQSKITTAQANRNIRMIGVTSRFINYQCRFGSVAGDNPIPKTSLQTLSTAFEFSWGRYEGVL